ncbi:DDB1- and CUL4-associated factor 10 homolog [Condylostylus longicornis]|uniref:DDB1- and CUL4-associated factor 10 homolog n=1 Tax=Condylostylus longicornis TaxID=2530218 RepID=UPI00244DDB85|nr:DDB1- and CUL4-associated factor 10 homolog [Condylostylus longicornis]XP_055377831.1 DDB1- and CUL4-associated factor 10 homolog [Condylostylus longicornis]
MTFYNWVTRRENGFKPKIGDEDFILKLIYKSLKPWNYWNEEYSSIKNTSDFGAVFNLEFSPDGNILVAACEKKSIVLYDSTTTKQTKAIVNAHTDNVNCVKFLDNRTFATCSDDTTVAIWDVRNLNSKVRSLQGHSNWVKNIEYSHIDNLLVTSGFDGSIYTWDISSYTEQSCIYQKVFHTSGLMRCRLTPDAKKLIICTTGGYLIIIHDLNLATLAKDLNGFKPNIYRLMQLGRQFIPNAAKFDNIFSKEQKRNRVELVSDFPEKNDAEIVCALQIHPQGWCCLSRNISYDQSSEWTCLHDIQECATAEREVYKENESHLPVKKRKLSETERSSTVGNSNDRPTTCANNNTSNSNIGTRSTPLLAMASASITRNGSTENRNNENANRNMSVNGSNRTETYGSDIWAAEVTVHDRAFRTSLGVRNSGAHAYAYVYPISSGVIPLSRSTAELNLFDRTNMRISLSSRTPSNNDDDDDDDDLDDEDDEDDDDEDSEDINLTYDNLQFLHGSSTSRNNINENNSQNTSPLTSSSNLICPAISFINSNANRKIYINHKRLMYYIEEPTKGQGFIKEQAFSADGRIICSPYENGVRLLAFNDDCSDLPTAVSCSAYKRPQLLKEINKISTHKDIVVSSRFNPKYPLLVTGCLAGNITWHQSDF